MKTCSNCGRQSDPKDQYYKSSMIGCPALEPLCTLENGLVHWISGTRYDRQYGKLRDKSKLLE